MSEKYLEYRNIETGITKKWKRDYDNAVMINEQGERWAMFGPDGFFANHTRVKEQDVQTAS